MASAIIANSAGGNIGVFLDYFRSLIESGQDLIVAGSFCASACTLFSIMPASQVCVQPTVTLKFHAAWTYEGYRKVKHDSGTAWIMAIYPQHLRTWIERHGGLTEPGVDRVMKYPETAKHFRICGY